MWRNFKYNIVKGAALNAAPKCFAEETMKVLVSACLLGIPCRFDGKSKEYDTDSLISQEIIPFCPECYGGLPIPRASSEIQNDRVVSSIGRDVTKQYQKGAESAVLLCKKLGIRYALLKSKSPSCGVGKIYDGSFSETLVDGDGITARALKQIGVRVYPEQMTAQLLNDITAEESSEIPVR